MLFLSFTDNMIVIASDLCNVYVNLANADGVPKIYATGPEKPMLKVIGKIKYEDLWWIFFILVDEESLSHR